MKVFTFKQYSTEHWDARRGVPTASEFGCILKPTIGYQVWCDDELVSNHRKESAANTAAEKLNKKKPGHRVVADFNDSAGQLGYIHRLIGDLYDPHYGMFEDYATAAMKNGTIMEPEARRFYEFERDCDVQEVGFCLTDDGRFGCSPDGLCGEDGGLELKSPTHATQVKYLLDGRLPDEYKAQVHGCLAVTGRKWWDWMSHAHGLPPLLIRVEPDEFTEKLQAALEDFWTLYDGMRQAIAKLGDPVAATREPYVAPF